MEEKERRDKIVGKAQKVIKSLTPRENETAIKTSSATEKIFA